MSENLQHGALGFADIAEPDPAARQAAADRLAALPGGREAFGVLGELGCWLAATQGSCPPQPTRSRILVVAADHGITAAGVSARPPEDTTSQIDALLTGTAPVAVAADVAGATLRVIDAGVDRAELSPGQESFRIRRGSGRIDREDALTDQETVRAVQLGRQLADAEADSGTGLLVAAAVGVGASTPASTLVAALTGTEPVAVVGPIIGYDARSKAVIDDQAWMRKVAAIRDALRRTRPHRRDPLALLRTAGGAELAVLTGLLAQAAARRTPVLIDGLVTAAAGLLAEELAPGARRWWLAAQASADPALAVALRRLELEPVATVGMRLGDGTAGATVLPLCTLAARLLAEAPGPQRT